MNFSDFLEGDRYELCANAIVSIEHAGCRGSIGMFRGQHGANG